MSSSTSEDSSSDHKSATVCFLCRQRKTKCDRILPKCGFCAKAKVDCRYVARPKKRGLRAGYVSELESRIEHLENEVNELKSEEPLSVMKTPSSRQSFPTTEPTPATVQMSSVGASSMSGSSTKRRRLNPESDAAVKDLMSLPTEYLFSLTDLWFKENQPWCPILNQQHIQMALDNLPNPVDHVDDLELRAVLSLEIAYSTGAISLGYHGRMRLSQHLRAQVLTEALSKASLSSVRALIIIAILDYGNDNIPSTFSLMSVCRRTCEHIGLFRKLLSQIELESPAQVGPPSRETTGGDEMTIPLTWGTLALDAVSTLGVSWRDVSAALVDHLSSVAYVSTPDLRDSYRAHIHLAAIGLQPLHQFIHDHELSQQSEVNEEVLARCDEMYHNLMGYVHAQPTTSYTLLADGVIDFDPNLVHTSILAHASVIIFYQRLIDFNGFMPEVPLARCLQACEGLVMSIRGMSDADAELNTPLLSHFFFVAARFKLIMYRALAQPREVSFDTLMHGINMSGRRWPVARRLDIVLRAAFAEIDQGDRSALPSDFWDLKRSHLDISEQLKTWINDYKPSLFVGSLNGPYV